MLNIGGKDDKGVFAFVGFANLAKCLFDFKEDPCFSILQRCQ